MSILLSYSKLCKRINIKELSGNSKIKQIKELSGICKFTKEKNKYKFEEIYKEPLKYIDGRWVDNRNDLFNVNIENKHKSGIYKIQLNNIIYIGQTNDFYDRFYRHRQSKSKAYELILKGGTFEITELAENLNERLKKEKMYIQKYCEDKNYVCINSDFNYINPNRKKRTFKGRKKNKYNQKYKKIKIKTEDYENVISILKSKGVDIYE